jgi:hypothetical protein
VRALWKGLTPFATHLTLKYALRMGSNSVYQVRAGKGGQEGGGMGAHLAVAGWGPCWGGTQGGQEEAKPLPCQQGSGPWFGQRVAHSIARAPPHPSHPDPSHQGMLRDENGKLTDARRMAAGFMAGITEALLIVTPFEVVKIRLQQQKGCSKHGLKYKVRGDPRGGGFGAAAATEWGPQGRRALAAAWCRLFLMPPIPGAAHSWCRLFLVPPIPGAAHSWCRLFLCGHACCRAGASAHGPARFELCLCVQPAPARAPYAHPRAR